MNESELLDYVYLRRRQIREAASRLRELSSSATEGPWAAYDMSDHSFNSENNEGWWWVWKKDVSHYAGVMQVDHHFDAEAGEPVPVGHAEITDTVNGVVERHDAEYIAAVDPVVGLAIAYWLDVTAAYDEASEAAGMEAEAPGDAQVEAAYRVAQAVLGEK